MEKKKKKVGIVWWIILLLVFTGAGYLTAMYGEDVTISFKELD